MDRPLDRYEEPAVEDRVIEGFYAQAGLGEGNVSDCEGTEGDILSRLGSRNRRISANPHCVFEFLRPPLRSLRPEVSAITEFREEPEFHVLTRLDDGP